MLPSTLLLFSDQHHLLHNKREESIERSYTEHWMYAESHTLGMPIIAVPLRILVRWRLYTITHLEMVVKWLAFQARDSPHTFNAEHRHIWHSLLFSCVHSLTRWRGKHSYRVQRHNQCTPPSCCTGPFHREDMALSPTWPKGDGLTWSLRGHAAPHTLFQECTDCTPCVPTCGMGSGGCRLGMENAMACHSHTFHWWSVWRVLLR